jgi:hypothetical protein
MSELDSTTEATENMSGSEDPDPEQNAEYLADAYEALAEDRRQHADLAGPQHSDALPSQPADVPLVADAGEPAVVDETVDPTAQTPADNVAEAPAPDHTGLSPANQGRRVFVIDNKEYPDPDPRLPITGTRSVQAMYRDYFPGQLDNADVAQKTRPDGTLEVTFKRRLGTKGARARVGGRTRTADPGEVVVTIARVAGVLAGLPEDRPLAWDLVEQAMGPKGTVRLDYVPPATQLNLAEAQQAARVRLIDLAVGELRRLRPCA